eukprot:GFYU01015937.1.p1 GENE.GFYU01015937.1~~GFYU01015937.1.p1  ORF type:complete len:147 (+),score=42.14 GFYU01015937.1:2-442(+)
MLLSSLSEKQLDVQAMSDHMAGQTEEIETLREQQRVGTAENVRVKQLLRDLKDWSVEMLDDKEAKIKELSEQVERQHEMGNDSRDSLSAKVQDLAAQNAELLGLFKDKQRQLMQFETANHQLRDQLARADLPAVPAVRMNGAPHVR